MERNGGSFVKLLPSISPKFLKWKRKLEAQKELDDFFDGEDSAFDDYGRHYQPEFSDWYVDFCVASFMADFFPTSAPDVKEENEQSVPSGNEDEQVPNWVFYDPTATRPNWVFYDPSNVVEEPVVEEPVPNWVFYDPSNVVEEPVPNWVFYDPATVVDESVEEDSVAVEEDSVMNDSVAEESVVEEPTPTWVFYGSTGITEYIDWFDYFVDDDSQAGSTSVSEDTQPSSEGFSSEAPSPFALFELDGDLLHHFTSVDVPDPTGLMKLIQGIPLYKHEENIRNAIRRASIYHLRFCEAKFKDISLSHLDQSDFSAGRTEAFYRTPGILDSGASFGLTPFIEDFITYQEVNITVKDVSSTNQVVGMGTVLYRIRATNGDWCWIPSLAYHLPTTDIRLISPQAYHQQYGGHSIITGDAFELHLAKPVGEEFVPHVLRVPIDPGTNLPMVGTNIDVAGTPTMSSLSTQEGMITKTSIPTVSNIMSFR